MDLFKKLAILSDIICHSSFAEKIIKILNGQWLWVNDIRLFQGVTKHEVYFPKDLWYDYYNPNNIIDGVKDSG